MSGQPQCGAPPKIPSLWLPIAPVSPTQRPQGLAPGRLWRLIQRGIGPVAGVLFSCSPRQAVSLQCLAPAPLLTQCQQPPSTAMLPCSPLPSTSPWSPGSAGPRDGARESRHESFLG